MMLFRAAGAPAFYLLSPSSTCLSQLYCQVAAGLPQSTSYCRKLSCALSHVSGERLDRAGPGQFFSLKSEGSRQQHGGRTLDFLDESPS